MTGEADKGNGAAKWIVGCGLGCLAAVGIVAIGIGVAAWFGWRFAQTEGKQQMAADFERQYQEWLAEHEMPAEYAGDYEALIGLMRQENTSLWGAMMAGSLLMTTLEDNAVTPEEGQWVAEFVQQLREKPDMGMSDMQRYMDAHPELRDAWPGGAGAWSGPAPPPAERSPEPVAPEEKAG